MSVLTTKLRRDIGRSKAQFTAIVVVIFLGITLFGGSYDAYRSLETSYQTVFDDVSFADLWVSGGDIPGFVTDASAVAGVAAVDVRHQADVALQPTTGSSLFGRIVGMPSGAQPAVNQVIVLSGTYLASPDQGLVERHMADHFELVPGDTVTAIGPGGRAEIQIAGIASSAEYLWPSRSRQDIITSQDDFGVLFVPDDAVARIAGSSAVEQAVVRYGAGADASALDARLEALAGTHGAADVYTRAEQASNSALQEDVKGFGELSFMFPSLFLTAAGLATWVLLTRLVMSQRPIIGTLLASGMSRGTIFRHYLSYGLAVALAGGIAGVVAGAFMAWGVAGLYTSAISVPVTVIKIDATTPITGLLFALVAGLTAAAFPAWRAIRLNPAEAMRGVFPTGPGRPTLAERLIPPLRRLPASGLLVLRGVFRNGRRTFTTMLGVVLALTLILVSWGMIDTVGHLLSRQYDQVQLSDAQVILSSAPDPQTLSALENVPGVAAVEPVVRADVAVSSGAATYATTLESYQTGTSMHGFLDGNRSIPLPPSGVLLGRAMGEILGVGVGDHVTVQITAAGAGFEESVAGFVDEPLGTYAYVSLESLQAELGTVLDGGDQATPAPAGGDTPSAGLVPGAEVRYRSGVDVAAMKTSLESVNGVVAVIGTKALEQTIRSFMGLFYVFVGVMLVFGGLLALGIIFNTMSVNLAERTVEVATLEAAGISQSRLARMITSENLIVTVLGLTPGLIIGYLMSKWFMGAYTSDQFSFDLFMRWTTMFFSAVFIVLVTMLSQMPGLRAIRRLDIASIVRERSI